MNQLKVNPQQSIVSLFTRGWSRRRIARELALDRATVRKYLAAGAAKPPTPQTGSLAPQGPVSLCDPWREPIAVAWVLRTYLKSYFLPICDRRVCGGMAGLASSFVAG